MDTVRLSRAAALIEDHVKAGKASTIASVVTRNGEIVFDHCVGPARPGGSDVTLNSMFPLYSGSKPMTSILTLMLAEDGLLGLTSRAVDYLPELAEGGNEAVIVANLLTHTAGWDTAALEQRIAERVEARDFGSVPAGLDIYEHVMLNLHWDIPAKRPPGELMEYWSWNHTLLGEIIRRVTGRSLHDVMTERLFEPLGMTQSAIVVGDTHEPHVIERSDGLPFARDDQTSQMRERSPSFLACDDGSIGVHSSPLDVARFNQFILDGGIVDGERLLSRAAIRTIVTDQVPNTPAEIFFGFASVEASWSFAFSVGSTTPWWKYGGATTPLGTLRHGGLGGIWTWIDLEHGIGGTYFEVVAEMDDDGTPPLWAANRFEEVVTASIL